MSDCGTNPFDGGLLCQRDELRAALTALVNHYVEMINSGDCGSWDPESEDVIKNARKALG